MPNKVESKESAEYIPSQEVFQTFLDIDSDTYESLQERLEDVQGHGRIWGTPSIY